MKCEDCKNFKAKPKPKWPKVFEDKYERSCTVKSDGCIIIKDTKKKKRIPFLISLPLLYKAGELSKKIRRKK